MPTDSRELTDAELEALLAEAAGAEPVPDGGPEGVLSAARVKAPSPAGARWKDSAGPWLRKAAVVAVVGVVGAALLVSLASFVFDGSRRTGDVSTSAGDSAEKAARGGTQEAPATTVESLAGDAEADVAGTPRQTAAVPAARARIVKTAGLEVEVGEGRFDLAVSRLTTLAAGAGGFVADSRSTEVGRSPSGTFTVRVPSPRFEDVLTQVRKLGKVKVSSASGEDVTAQFTDLEARITSLAGTRDQLRTLQGEARTIPDILAVQDRLTAVQIELEQLQGQSKLLEDKASFGTLTVNLREPRPGGGGSEPSPRSGFGQAWHEAVDGFTGGLERILAGSGSFLVVMLCLAGLVLAGRAAWRVGGRRFL